SLSRAARGASSRLSLHDALPISPDSRATGGAMKDATARGAAAALVLGVTEARISLADQFAGGALDALAPPDRARAQRLALAALRDRKSTRLNSSHVKISYAVFCL